MCTFTALYGENLLMHVEMFLYAMKIINMAIHLGQYVNFHYMEVSYM